MYSVTQTFLDAQAAGEQPFPLVSVQSRMGRRVYSTRMLPADQIGMFGGPIQYDGRVAIGDDVLFGYTTIVLECSPALVSVDPLRETLVPSGANLITGLMGSEIASLSAGFANGDGHFSDILGAESFIGQEMTVSIGFPSCGFHDFLRQYSGAIVKESLDDVLCQVSTQAAQQALTDVFTMPRAGLYAHPANASDILPMPFGDLSVLPVDGGVWVAVCIDTVNQVWCLSACGLISTGNSVVLYDDDGVISSAEYAVTYSADYEGAGLNIAYVTFSVPPVGNVGVQAKGCAPDGVLLENPVDILGALLDVMAPAIARNATAFARARLNAEEQGLKAAGVLLQDQNPAFWVSQLIASFLGDWWINPNGEFMVALDAGVTSLNIVAFLGELVLAGPPSRDLANCCNQPVVYYAPNFSQADRRTRSGVSLDNFDGFDDGSAVVDLLSQSQFGVQQRPVILSWVRDSASVATEQAQIVNRFRVAPWDVLCAQPDFRAIQVERGDYVVASCRVLRDEQQRPLVNQVWRVLEIEKNALAGTIGLRLLDTGLYYPETPILYDGAYQIGSYAGRQRVAEMIV